MGLLDIIVKEVNWLGDELAKDFLGHDLGGGKRKERKEKTVIEKYTLIPTQEHKHCAKCGEVWEKYHRCR